MTRILPINDPNTLTIACDTLRAGHPVAFPTDTVYGIGAPASNPTAILQLYALKQRPRSSAIPVLLADMDDVPKVARDIPGEATRLMQRYWPGGLSLIVPAAPHLPAELLAGGDTVAVRMPAHPWLRHLIRSLGEPLAATSANMHSAPTPRTAEGVAAALGDALALVVDGGASASDVPSTLVDCTGGKVHIVRQGAFILE